MSACSCETIDDTVYVSTVRGDTVELDVALLDKDSVPLPVTRWLWLAQVRDTFGTVVAEYDMQNLDEEKGTFTLVLESAITGTLLGDYDWDLQATDLDADVRTLLTGHLRIKEDVSR